MHSALSPSLLLLHCLGPHQFSWIHYCLLILLPSLQDIILKCKTNHFTLVLKIFQQTPYCFEDAMHMLKPIDKALHKLITSSQPSLPFPFSTFPTLSCYPELTVSQIIFLPFHIVSLPRMFLDRVVFYFYLTSSSVIKTKRKRPFLLWEILQNKNPCTLYLEL